MAKKTENIVIRNTRVKRRHRERGLHIRKKLGPKSNMRIR
jgi:hypothetical protein